MRKEIEDLLAKKDFSEGLLKLDDVSKVKDYFTTKGNLKDVTDEEIKELGSSLENLMQKVSELPEDKLEKIGGGANGVNLANPDGKKQNIWSDIDRELDRELAKKIGIGAASLGGLAAAGAGIYKIGNSKGWWNKFKRK